MIATLLKWLFPHDRHHVVGLHETIARRLPADGVALDLGCGANDALDRHRAAGRSIWGADFERHSRLAHPDWFRLLADDGSIPFPDATFDVVVAIMVLEHVRDPDIFLREISRVLKPGGTFIGHTISGIHYVTGLRRFIGLLPHAWNQRLVRVLYGRAEEDTFPAYYRLNRRGSIERACRASGLVLDEVERYADPGYFHFCRPLEAMAVFVDRLLDTLVPGCGRLYLTMTATRPPSARSRAA